jgi:hypothetical protein
MATIPHLLLADVGDVLKNLAPIIFVVLYGVAHLVGNLQQEKRKAAAARPRPVPPPEGAAGNAARNVAPGQAAGGNQPTLEETLRREVEEFLRRAQGGQPQQPKGQPPRQPRPQQRPAARGPARQAERTTEEGPQPTRRLVDTPRPESASAPPRSESRTPLTSAPLSAGVAAHAQSISAQVQGVSLHAQSLGADIAQTDERMEEHLRHKFAHQVGAVAPTTSVQRQATGSAAAAELRALLARPGGAKQLIIASEILRRPEERWGK